MKKTAAEGDRRFEIVLQLFVTIYIVTLDKKEIGQFRFYLFCASR